MAAARCSSLDTSVRSVNFESSPLLDRAISQRGAIDDGTLSALSSASARTISSRLGIFVLCAVNFGQEVMYSVELAYAAPLLLQYELPRRYISLVMMFSPLLSVLVTPLAGHASDSLRLAWGRRRPFVLLFAAVLATGALVLTHAPTLAHAAASSESRHVVTAWTVAFGVAGFTLLDFGLDALEAPSRSLVADLVPAHAQDTAAASVSVLTSVGAGVGFGLGAVDISAAVPALGTHAQALAAIGLTLFAAALVPTLVIAREGGRVSQAHSGSACGAARDGSDGNGDGVGDADGDAEPGVLALVRFIFSMPSGLARLFVLTSCDWVGVVAFAMFFTDYCGHAVYAGLPVGAAADVARYNAGVRFGSLCLALSGVPNFVLSFALPALMDALNIEAAFILCTCPFGLACVALLFAPSRAVALVAALTFGAAVAGVVVVPFVIAGVLCPAGQTGRYMAVTAFTVSVAQLGVGLTGGFVMDTLGSGAYLAACGVVSALGGLLVLTVRTADGKRVRCARAGS